MPRNARVYAVVAALLTGLSSCGGGGGATTELSEDTTGQPADVPAADAIDVMRGGLHGGTTDASGDAQSNFDAVNAAMADTGWAGMTTTPWGRIDPACSDVLANSAVDSSSASFVDYNYLFDKTDKFDPRHLSVGAKKRYRGPNAGGSSKCSEVMSMQFFVDCAGATVHKIETEVTYAKAGPITDYVLNTATGKRIGVSVTRAYKGPMINTYSEADAQTLLTKKLKGINESSLNVAPVDKWQKQVLHIWTLHADWAPILRTAWNGLPIAEKADTIVVITVEQNTAFVVPDACE